MPEFEVCLQKTYWKFVKVEAESEKEAEKIALEQASAPNYFDDWTDYNNSIKISY
jgi:hypothetical protein